jgi:tetratricopeptide (TPR) repeat protein
LRGESAKALFRLAQITGDIGSKTEAIDLHKKAAAVFETLAATPDKSDFRADQAACYHHLGRLYRTIDKLKQSDEYYDKAEKTWETLVTANPKDSRYQAGLARTLMGIGNARLSASRPAEAQPMYEKSRAAWQELAKTNRATGDYQREVGVNYSNLGMIYQDQAGKEKNAEKSLRTAWGIQKKLVDDAPNIGKYQNDFAVTNYLLAKSLVRTTDRKADAKAYFQEAADRWQTLINQQPAVLDYQKRAAEAYLALATLERIERDWTAAEATCRKALAVQRKLAERYKDDEDFQVGLAGGLYALGEICSANKQDDRSKEAEPAFEEAIAIQKKLATKPNPPPYRLRDLAKSFNGLGVFHMNHGQEQKATTAFKNAVTQWESLVTINPASDEFALGLSDSCFNLGNMARLAARPKDAEAWFTRAADCFDLKNTALLADPRVQLKLSNAYWMRADTLTKLRSFDDALKDWDRALRYAKDDMKFAIRLPRAAALARAGKHAEAVKEANEMIALARGGEAYFRFVRVYALAATAAKDDQNSSDEYAMQGIKALTKAVEAGYFKSAANLTRLQDDPEFQVLRDRPEFKKLVNDLKMQ